MTAKDYASKELLDFAIKNSGRRILDLGCATGEYCRNLRLHGYETFGLDINKSYAKKANMCGEQVCVMSAGFLGFKDKSFDTVLLFEVLEHIQNPTLVLLEARRIARKNILVTVPNCGGMDDLRSKHLTFEHMLEKDHVNYFTAVTLGQMFSPYFQSFSIEEREPLSMTLPGLPAWASKPISLFYKLGWLKHHLFFRLYARINL